LYVRNSSFYTSVKMALYEIKETSLNLKFQSN
jgi:hypothetical protein